MDNIISIKRKPDKKNLKDGEGAGLKSNNEVIKELKLLFQAHADRERRLAEERELANKKIIRGLKKR